MSFSSCDGCAWLYQILDKVDFVPKLRSPGSIIVFGARAHAAVVTSSGDVIMGLAEVGEGRLVLFSHNAYLNSVSSVNAESSNVLHDNIKKWVTKGAYSRTREARELKHIESLTNNIPLVICRGNEHHREDELLDYIRSGGGVIYGLCPWGYLQSNHQRSVTRFPLQRLLDACGMAFAGSVAKHDGNSFLVTNNTISKAHDHHLVVMCEHVMQDENHLIKYGRQLSLQLLWTPSIGLAQIKDHVAAIFDRYVGKLDFCIPTKDNKVTDQLDLILVLLYNALAILGMGHTRLPGIEHFPGDFSSSPESKVPPLTCTDLTIISALEEIHPLGYYLQAGKEMMISVQQQKPKSGCFELIIGAHMDKLSHQSELRRWPIISHRYFLHPKDTRISSAVGGQLYIGCPQNSVVFLRLEGVVESPLFSLSDLNASDRWPQKRLSAGLWADIVGKHLRLTLPSSSVKSVEDPSDVMPVWDRLVTVYHELRGTDVNMHKKQWVVCDVQPSAGYMHSGYPIVTHMDVSQLNNDKFLLSQQAVSNGLWGIFHELGHNMQRSWWTFTGTREVTCNIFTLYGMDVITGTRMEQTKAYKKGMKNIKRYMEEGNTDGTFATWQKEPWLALLTYMQLAHYFGWEAYKKVFRAYEALPKKQRPKSFQEKINLWVVTFSRQVNHDLRPFFDLWRWPYTNHGVKLENMPLFLPYDVISSEAGARILEIESHYKDQSSFIHGFSDGCPFGEVCAVSSGVRKLDEDTIDRCDNDNYDNISESSELDNSDNDEDSIDT